MDRLRINIMRAWLQRKFAFNEWKEKVNTLKKVIPFIIGNKVQTKLKVLGAGLLSIATTLFNLLQPFALTKTIESFGLEEQETLFGHEMTPQNWVLIFGTIWTCSQVFDDLRSFLINEMLWESQAALSDRFIAHVGDLSFPYRANSDNSIETTKNLLDRSQSYIVNLVYSGLLSVVPNITEILASVALIHQYFGLEYTVKLWLILGSYIIFTAKTSRWVETAHDQAMEIERKVAGRIGDLFSNLNTVEYNANLNYEKMLCAKHLETKRSAYSSSYLRWSCKKLGQDTILGIGFIFFFYAHVNNISSGKFKISDFILLFTYFSRFISPVNSLGSFANAFYKSLIELEATFKFLEKKPVIKELPNADKLAVKPYTIEFKNVYFKYPKKEKAIFEGISFTIKAGQKVAFVGETGSGKSTIENLLFRFYDVDRGDIFINNQNIKYFTLDSLRKAIAIVPQEIGIFNRSIKDNIRYGNPKCDNLELQQAIEDSQLTTLLQNDNSRLESIVAEGGSTLSGGEKQRIGICRAL